MRSSTAHCCGDFVRKGTANNFDVSWIRRAAVLALALTFAIASVAGAQVTAAVTDTLNAASEVADLIDHFADTGNFDPHQDMLVFAALRMTYTRLPPDSIGVASLQKTSCTSTREAWELATSC